MNRQQRDTCSGERRRCTLRWRPMNVRNCDIAVLVGEMLVNCSRCVVHYVGGKKSDLILVTIVKMIYVYIHTLISSFMMNSEVRCHAYYILYFIFPSCKLMQIVSTRKSLKYLVLETIHFVTVYHPRPSLYRTLPDILSCIQP